MKQITKDIVAQYKFCFICGSKLKYNQANSFTCTGCGFNFYVNPTFCTAAILENEKGEILLVKRKLEPKKGYWDSPGGFVDLEESVEEGMVRELKEELGLDIKEIKYFKSYSDTYFWDGINFATIGLTYIAKINSQEKMTATDDVAGFKFFKKEEIPLDEIGFESFKQALSDYISSE